MIHDQLSNILRSSDSMTKTILISTIIALTAVGITSAYALTTVDSDLDVTGTISGIGTVPIGTVLDWWCPLGCTIPDGFVIADGSVVNDSESPLNGETLPNLTNKFIKGVAVSNLDTMGGTSTHSHSHNHPSTPSSNSGSNHFHQHDHPVVTSTFNSVGHTHSVNPPSTPTTFDTHNHRWSKLGSDEDWDTWDSDGNLKLMTPWTNGQRWKSKTHDALDKWNGYCW